MSKISLSLTLEVFLISLSRGRPRGDASIVQILPQRKGDLLECGCCQLPYRWQSGHERNSATEAGGDHGLEAVPVPLTV